MTVLIVTPALVKAKGTILHLVPEIIEAKNSQTMALLEAPLNINPSLSTGLPPAIIDNNALSSERDSGATFIDAGKSGTGQISVYVVRKGDSLGLIAKMFGVSTNTIVWANNIGGGIIREGDQLVILPVSGVNHTVKKGDTIQSIAKLYKADGDDIISYNDITIDSKLSIGDIVMVPDGEPAISPSISPNKPSTSNLPTYAGYYQRPINGGRKTQGIHGYNGVDLASPTGTPIYAAADGAVIISRTGYNGGYGTYVVVSHTNGTQTVYAHMSKGMVIVGQRVEQGQIIGAVGNTGKSTGAHVHFEIRGAKNPF